MQLYCAINKTATYVSNLPCKSFNPIINEKVTLRFMQKFKKKTSKISTLNIFLLLSKQILEFENSIQFANDTKTQTKPKDQQFCQAAKSIETKFTSTPKKEICCKQNICNNRTHASSSTKNIIIPINIIIII